MNLAAVNYLPCDKCGTKLNKDQDFGFEDNQTLCQACYNKVIDEYEAECVETKSYREAYDALLHKYNKLKTESGRTRAKLRVAQNKLAQTEGKCQ